VLSDVETVESYRTGWRDHVLRTRDSWTGRTAGN